jgi:hypothetical protein
LTDEREYERELNRIREADIEDEFRRNPKLGSGLKTFMFCAFVTALCLLAYFGLVASH